MAGSGNSCQALFRDKGVFIMTNKKKTSRQKRTLIGAVCVAAVIMAGSTFAWFTSQDEVTNRLSASANYGVAIAESFQPPENWVPGQEINKDAGAVNTGNVDAFVRMYLDGSMRLLQQSKSNANASAKAYGTNSVTVSSLTAVTDVNLLNANLTYQDAEGNYFRTLDKTQTKNPKSSFSTNNDGYSANEELNNTKTGAYSEVQAMQSGILAYAPANAKYSYVLDEETELEIAIKRGTEGSVTYEKVQVPAGTLVMVCPDITSGSDKDKAATVSESGVLTPYATAVTVTSTSGATHSYTSTVYVKSQARGTDVAFVPQNVEYESFTPMSDGLYLFLRNEKNADQEDPEFSGYYVDGIDGTNKTPATGTYFALNTGVNLAENATAYRSDYTVKGAETVSYTAPVKVTYDNGTGSTKKNIIGVLPSENLELFNAQYQTIDANKLKFYADAVVTTGDDANTQNIYAVYDADGDTNFNKNKDIIVVIKTANVVTSVGDNAETWTSIGTTNASSQYDLKDKESDSTKIALDATNLKFYYNNDVEAGDSTVKLVDKVTLYSGVTNKAYLAFDFDLNVHLDSVQVTFDENGKELDTAVSASGGAEWKDTATNGGATGARQNDDNKEIIKVTWAATTT